MVASNDSMPLYFEPAFDDQAQPLQQTSGSVLALPQHTPYRIVNDGDLGVTLTTKYMTRESERRNKAHRANHMLNRFFPSDTRSVATSGIGSAAKRLFLRVASNRLTDTSIQPMDPTFCVNPDSPLCVGPLTTTALKTDTSIPIFPGLHLQASTPATAGWEN
jgi:hypothetical protein